jgi:hypothetical protein
LIRYFSLAVLFFLSSFFGHSQKYTQFSFDSLSVSTKKVNLYVIPLGVKVEKQRLREVGIPYQKAKLSVQTVLLPEFKTNFAIRWSNPNSDHKQFTKQMKRLRNSYFEQFDKDPNSIYCFVIPKFENDSILGFSIPGKSIAFITESGFTDLIELNQLIGSTLGLKFESDSSNIMSSINLPNKELSWEQCVRLRENPITFSYYDDFENISSNNGLVSTLIWTSDEQGNIDFDRKSPFSSFRTLPLKNTFLVYRKITNFWLKELFVLFGKSICAIHICSIIVAITLTLYFRKRFNLIIAKSGFFKRMSLRFMKLILWLLFFAIVIGTFLIVNYYYENSYLRSVHLTDFEGNDIEELKSKLSNQKLFINKKTKKQFNQTFQREGSDWKVTKERKVLYFKIKSENDRNIGQFVGSKNKLFVRINSQKLKFNAESPYIVLSFYDANNKFLKDEVYNFQGKNITSKMRLPDPAKRILVFVNGYRPVSVSNSLEDNLKDIQKNGIEYPDSKNILYDFDRHQYWTPWNQINSLFINRINPSDVWYADGHHSVSTSNFESVVNFSAISSVYPTTCKNLKKHKCQRTKIAGEKSVDTYSLLATKSNLVGFKLRKKSGQIAGMNLNSLLNELPNLSENDTLFIVCHSMGYAYSLGIIQELRGKINFGGFYILAPENACAGKTIKREWKEVWQYGANFEPKKRNAPCLQDGVAAQTKAKGLGENNRVFFPKENEKNMGFFKSHFVGFYTWIFDIPQGKKGAVKKH